MTPDNERHIMGETNNSYRELAEGLAL
ncbi:hypothetical protein EMIT07CA2_40429 [Brevibacillus sp. IT-7CA2]